MWLASYPKSGNTWTRAFLHNLVHVTSGQKQTQKINELDQFSVGSAGKPFFEEVIGFELTDKRLPLRVPECSKIWQMPLRD